MNLEIKKVEIKKTPNRIEAYCIRNDGSYLFFGLNDLSGHLEPESICIDSITRKLISKHYIDNKLPDYNQRLVNHFDSVKELLLSKVVYI